MSDKTYKIVRYYKSNRSPRTIKTGLSLEAAKKWCQDPASRGRTWFEGFTEEVK